MGVPHGRAQPLRPQPGRHAPGRRVRPAPLRHAGRRGSRHALARPWSKRRCAWPACCTTSATARSATSSTTSTCTRRSGSTTSASRSTSSCTSSATCCAASTRSPHGGFAPGERVDPVHVAWLIRAHEPRPWRGAALGRAAALRAVRRGDRRQHGLRAPRRLPVRRLAVGGRRAAPHLLQLLLAPTGSRSTSAR